MKYLNNILIIFLAGVFIVSNSCVKEEYDFNKLSTDMSLSPRFVFPVVTGILTLGNSFEEKDDTIVVNEDGIIKLMFHQDSLFQFDVNELVDIEDQTPPVPEAVLLGSVFIENFSYNGFLTLDDISLNFDAPTRSDLVTKNNTTDIFPVVSPPNSGNFDMPPFSNFTQVVVDSGKISIEITNNLPVEVSFTLRLKQASGQIGSDFVFSSIAAGGSQTRSIDDISGNLTNDFNFDIIDFSSPGSSPATVPIYLSDQLVISLNSDYVVAYSGTAVLIDQVFFEETDTIDVEVESGTEITDIEFISANVNYTFDSDIHEKLTANIIIPSGMLNGETLRHDTSLAAEQTISSSWSLAGASIDLAFDPARPYNKLPLSFSAAIESSGNMIDFDFVHAFLREYTITDINIAYVEGYFGQEIISLDQDSIDLDMEEITKNITGTLIFTNPRISIPYTNSIGVPAEVEILLNGEDSDGNNVDLNAPVTDIERPADRNDPDVEGSIDFTRDNSAIVDLIELRPETIRYSGEVKMNPDGPTGTRDNFLKSNSSIVGDLDVEIPSSIIADNLLLKDTIENPFHTDDPDEFGLDDLEYFNLYVSAVNGFPLEIGFTITPYDEINGEYPALDVPQLFPAAAVDASGRVSEPAEMSEPVVIELDSIMLANLQNADSLIVQARFNTTENGTEGVTFYVDYSIDFRLAVGVGLNMTIDK